MTTKLPDIAYSQDTYYKYQTGKYYNDVVLDARFYPYLFDGWTDRKFYALTNKSGISIHPKVPATQIYKNANGVLQKNIVFVVDAFNEMRAYYNSLVRTDKLDKTSRLYIELNAAGSMVDLDDQYLPYIQTLYTAFTKTYLADADRKQIVDIDSFLRLLIPFLSRVAHFYPLNRSSFISSVYCPLELNGLVISLENRVSYNDTKSKIESYVGDPNFQTFLDAASRYGFMVDKNNPWRMIADLESPAMKTYYSVYGLKNSDDVLNKFYYKTHESDLETLKNVLVGLWNTYAAANKLNISKDYIAGCDSLMASVKINNGIDTAMFDKYYNTSWLIRLYAYLKAIELNTEISQERFEALYIAALQLAQISIDSAAAHVNNQLLQYKKIIKHADESSLTDLENVVRLLEKQQQNLPTKGLAF